MPFRIEPVKLDKSAGLFRRALQYAFYDWTREMPKSRRVITYVGVVLQAYAVYAMLMWAFTLPKWLDSYFLVLPKGPVGCVSVVLIYTVGLCVQNGMLTSEFVRKTQLETDQIAARQVQQTLHPEKLEELPGYSVETFYKALREVGGDYFDIIELPGDRTLFAVADVSGKGMPAALLAANIQALVRSIASLQSTPIALAEQINKHLCRYTPNDRFATAVFILLNRNSGELTYVNAGHNAPIVLCSGSVMFLAATGPPLGLFTEAEYEARTAVIRSGGALLVFTDGLTDSIPGEHPENRLLDVLDDGAGGTMARLKSLVDPKFNEDDVTILLVKRVAGSASGGVQP
jgi:serine phosphatase RsbU (regulator of sigma subunit)